MKAVEFYTMALMFNPNHFKAIFNRGKSKCDLGFAFDKLRMYNDAISDYTKAIEMDPKNAYAYYNRGISHDKKGDYNIAIKDFIRAIELDPTKADFYHNKGFAMKKKNLIREAI